MKNRKRPARYRRRGVPLWIGILIDAFIVSVPCIIKKVAQFIKQIGGQ